MVIDIFNTDNKYDIIYADPPWRQSKGGKKKVRPLSSGTSLDYNVLSLDEIKEHLAIATGLSNDNGILFLWTIEKYLHEAEELAKELGYKLHTRMIWEKVIRIPAAFTIRYGHEYLLYMYKGEFIPVAKNCYGKYHSVFREKVTKHSKKPLIAYEMIENLYPNSKRLEIYARNERDRWDCWGNEIKCH